MTHIDGSGLRQVGDEDLDRTIFCNRAFLGRKLASFLNEIPEGGRCSLERTVGLDAHFVDVGLAGDVSRHFPYLLALEGCEERNCGES